MEIYREAWERMRSKPGSLEAKSDFPCRQVTEDGKFYIIEYMYDLNGVFKLGIVKEDKEGPM